MNEVVEIIPFANPKAAYILRQHEINVAIRRVLEKGVYILGPEVEAFENEFAEWLGGEGAHFLGVANGTDAIELALRALSPEQGCSVVFSVSHTAVATIAAIERAGCVPVLVDVDKKTYTMDPFSLENALSYVTTSYPKLKPLAIIPVHIYGTPCDMTKINQLALKYNLQVIEDCAQAHGVVYEGKKAGTYGLAGTFSFYPTKNLGALGDAGGIFSCDTTFIEACKALRQYGWRERYISFSPGINSRLDPLQAAILRVQLAYLDEDNKKRRDIAALYSRLLSGTNLVLPYEYETNDVLHAYHLYVIQIMDRKRFMDYMQSQGVLCAIHYPQPVHRQPAYEGRLLLPPGGLPVTEKISNTIVSLPMYPQLEPKDVEYICEHVKNFLRVD